MKVIWTLTGDVLEIDVTNFKVIDYWLDQLNLSDKNSFRLVDTTFPDRDLVTNLVENIECINQILTKFKLDPLLDSDSDWYNQDNLNLLHNQWVKLQQTHKIIELLSKFKGDALQKFHDINHLIHKIEFPISIIYNNDKSKIWQTPNPFGPDILQFGIWQIEIDYQNLGRSTFEKWVNYDKNVIDTDTNNFTHFSGRILFNIRHPVNWPAPHDYISYCKKNNVQSYGNKLPIGNFKDSITTLRHVFYKNIIIDSNSIFFAL